MTPTEALSALDTLYASCRRCANHRVNLIRAVGDRRRVAHKAAHEEGERDWSRLLDRAERDLASAMEHTEAHLAEPHDAPAPKRPAPARRPASVEDTRPECPRCGTRVALNARGRLGAHRGPSGLSCPRRLLAVDIELPPVNVPATPKRSPTVTRAPGEPSRLDAGSNCEDCGRWLPGERILCGRCFNHRARAG